MSKLDRVIEKKVKPHGAEYQDRKENGFRIISPSGASKFITSPYEWRVNVLDSKATFFGNEATVIGSLVHHYIDLYRKNSLTSDGKIPSVDRDAIVSTTTDLDIKTIYSDYPKMCEAVKEHYLDIYPTDVLTEKYFELELTDKKVLVAGTVDELDLENKVLTDFKTCSKAPKDETSVSAYIYQLSVYYALMEKLEGIKIDKFRIVFIQRPTKTIGSRIYIAEWDSNLELGKDLLNNILQTIDIVDNQPNMKDIIFRENPLSGFTMPDKIKVKEFCDKYIKNFKLVTQEESKIKQIKKNIFA